MADIQRIDLPWGYVLFGSPGLNEVTIVNTQPGDPPGLRFVSPDGNCGKWSFCVGADPATAVEVCIVQGKTDERTRGRDDLRWGEITFHVKGEPLNPADPRDDGQRPVGLLLHDYVWWKGINGDQPVKPWVTLPPPKVPVPVPPPTDPPPITPEERAQRVDDVLWARDEFAPMELDEGKVNAYLQGRSSLREFHDDNVQRAGTHNPAFHRPGRPY